MIPSCDLTVCCIRTCSSVSGRITGHTQTRTHLEWSREPLERLIQTLARQQLLLARLPGQIPRLADHPLSMTLDVEQGVQKLSFTRRGLVDPGEHVADVSCRVVCVEFDGSRETVRSAAREGLDELLKEEGLTSGS